MSQHLDKMIDPNHLAMKPILSRGQLQELEEDPSKMETVARLMGAINLDNLFRFMQGSNVNPALKIEFQKMLNKMGRLEPETKNPLAGAGPQVVINITRAKDNDSITIEGTSEPVAE